MSVTQKDIAQNLGVSRELVKFALSGTGRVRAETRELICAEARRLGYTAQQNREARTLIARRYGKRLQTDIIAVMMPTSFFGGLALPRLPFFAPFIEGIEQAAGERGLDIFLCSPHDGKLPRLIESKGVDGVICLANPLQQLLDLDLPKVNFGDSGSHWAMGIAPDNRAGARLATEHLMDLGHKQIACLAFVSDFGEGNIYRTAQDRANGYYEALATAGLKRNKSLFIGNITSPGVEQGATAMRELLQTSVEFTGVVCFNDLIAMGAIEVLRESGRRVPHDVSVVGFDDVSEQYSFRPKITSIAFDRFAMGQRAVELLCAARSSDADGGAPPPHDETFPVELVVRKTTKVCRKSSK